MRKQLSSITPTQYFEEQLPRLLSDSPPELRRLRETIRVVVEGEGGGEWTVHLGDEPTCQRGCAGTPDRTVRMDAAQLTQALRHERLNHRSFFGKGRDISVIYNYTPPVGVPTSDVARSLKLLLDGTMIKVDHFKNQPAPEGLGYSFIQFGPLLQALGYESRALDIPVVERNMGWINNVLNLATGSWYMVDRARFRVNNLRTTLNDETVHVELKPDTLVLRFDFKSNAPTVKGDGQAYLMPLGGIPLGWVDSTIPDVNMTDISVQLAVMPYVNSAGAITIDTVDVVLDGTITGSIASLMNDTILETATDAFANELNTQEFRDMLSDGLDTFLRWRAARVVTGWTGLQIDETGITAYSTP